MYVLLLELFNYRLINALVDILARSQHFPSFLSFCTLNLGLKSLLILDLQICNILIPFLVWMGRSNSYHLILNIISVTEEIIHHLSRHTKLDDLLTPSSDVIHLSFAPIPLFCLKVLQKASPFLQKE